MKDVFNTLAKLSIIFLAFFGAYVLIKGTWFLLSKYPKFLLKIIGDYSLVFVISGIILIVIFLIIGHFKLKRDKKRKLK